MGVVVSRYRCVQPDVVPTFPSLLRNDAHTTQMASSIESATTSRLLRSERTVAFAYVFAIVLAVAEVALDLGTWVALDIASIYGVPLVLAAFTRNRWLLWGLMVMLTLATFSAYALQIPAGTFALREALFVNRVLDAAALLLISGLLHVWMTSLDTREVQEQRLEEQNRKLESANALLIAHEAQIVRQNAELIQRRREAEDTSGRKTRLLNAVSHDIRNPVNTINLMAGVIRHAAEDPSRVTQVPQMARRLQSNAQALVTLVSDMLDIAQLDSGLLQRRESTFSLGELIEAKCRDFAPLAEAKLLYLNSEMPEPICVRTDRTKLDRIVTNLVTNAIKFTAEGGVTISAAVAADRSVLIRVSDTGSGIAGEQLERIFDEFAQFDVTLETPDKGWGLGLAICRRLATFIGAGIGVESKLDRGTVFTIRLPSECVADIAPVTIPRVSPVIASRG
jgi:signal transduction histidine kinase